MLAVKGKWVEELEECLFRKRVKLTQPRVLLLSLVAMKFSSRGFPTGYKDEIRKLSLGECARRGFLWEKEIQPMLFFLPWCFLCSEIQGNNKILQMFSVIVLCAFKKPLDNSASLIHSFLRLYMFSCFCAQELAFLIEKKYCL